MSGPALGTVILVFGKLWAFLNHLMTNMRFMSVSHGKSWRKKRDESHMSDSSSHLWSSLWIPEETAPICSQGLITETNSACTMPTKYWERQENSEEWWLCSCMLLLEACNKKADWMSWESSRPGLQNTLGQLNNLFVLPGAQKTVWQGVLPASTSTHPSCAAAKKSVVSHSVERQRRGKVDEETRRMEEQREW